MITECLKHKNIHRLLIPLVLAVSLTCIKTQAPQSYHSMQQTQPDEPELEYPYAIEKNATLFSELLGLGFNGQDVRRIMELSKPYYNLARLPQGLRYRLIYANNPLVNWGGLEFQLSPTKTLRFTLNRNSQWEVKQRELQVEVRIVSFVGSVRNSLWESARLAKMSPQLIAQLTEIFGWELDFSRQVTENDSWRLSVEQQVANGRVVGWGRILAAEYKNNMNSYSAVYYEKPGRLSGYFDLDGQSLSKSFLRSPIEFARISSGFSLRRFHPKLKIFRPHLGVDYAAPKGTPIRSIGEGRVLEAHYTAGGGNTITISHGQTYKTRYLHMSGFAAKVHVGAQVKQGQVIGYVGSTGLSTGPHLHFEFYQNNRYTDPLRVELPASESIPSELLADFSAVSAQRISQMPPLPKNIASN